MDYEQITGYLLRHFFTHWRRSADSDGFTDSEVFNPNNPAQGLFTPVLLPNMPDDRFNDAREGAIDKFPDVRRGWQTHEGFVSVSVIHDDSAQTTIGVAPNRRFERSGFVDCIIYTREGYGVYSHDVIASKFRDIFEGKRVDMVRAARVEVDAGLNVVINDGIYYVVLGAPVYFDAARYTVAGNEDGAFSSVATVPFHYDVIK